MVLRRGICNKQRLCQITSLLLLFCLVSSPGMMLVSFSIGSYSSSNIDERVNTERNLAGHIPHGNIIINDDDDFVAQSWPGSGIEGDPYRIENLNISEGTTICIDIQNTRAHVLIKNCTIYGPYDGIKLDNVTNVVIEECVFISCDYGIELQYSDFNLVSDSNFTNCASGIMFYNSHDNEFINNTVSVVGWRSVYISRSDRNTVHLNNLTGGFHGVYLTYSNLNIVSNNTCLMNVREVIILWYSDNTTIIGNYFEGTSSKFVTIEITRGYLNKLYDNTLTGKGIRVFDVQSIDAIGNTLNGKPLVFIVNEEYLDFSGDAGQVIILHSNNITVRDQVIANVGYGIQVKNCENITLKDNLVANNTWSGIDVGKSPSTILQNNTCYGNDDSGIYISDSPCCIIEENTCFDNVAHGIYVFDSDQSLVQDNVCYSNDYTGIRLHATYYVTVANNNCTDTNFGIYISQHGNCNISSNLLPDNTNGIYLYETDDNLIHMNNLSNYATEGILLEDS
ncbi:MAG: right-handed parallel beta-helix repeat-containing protein, partial [Candidatus Thorarchaeota archaeon]|nr:right-handed parallel beta-helix repeat-containing protein [Candidatus Thorarchaeota archaeon]